MRSVPASRTLAQGELHHVYLRYGAAVLTTLIALLLTLLLSRFRPSAETPAFLLAVAVTAWFGGAGPALLATLLSAACVDFFVFPERMQWSFRTQDWIGLLWFFSSSAVIASLANRKSQAVRAVEASEATLRQFVDYTPTPVAMFDEHMRYIAVSHSWYHTYTIPEGSVIGRCHYDVVPDIPERWKEIHRRCLRGIPASSEEDAFPRADGSVEYVRWQVQPWRRAGGEIGGIIMFAELITERKRQEQSLRHAEKLAAAGRLAATVAHEINNPLEAVTNLLYLAKSQPESAERYLDMADRELRRVTHMAQQTLGFYRDTGEVAPVDVGQIASEVLQLYEVKLQEKSILPEARLEAGVQVLGLAGEIRQVISNLVMNGIDAAQVGGRLVLKVAAAKSWNGTRQPGVRIVVADSGCGIQHSDRKKIFDAFWTTKRNTGTGLGLWVTRSMVEKAGGTIRVRSSVTPNRSGSAFSVFLPANCERAEIARTGR
jgi:two-component system, cell cycle sensor histidine kinase and response regulator CckA